MLGVSTIGSRHHDTEESVWVKIHKVRSGLPTISPEQAIEMALCWGWIDGLRKGLNEHSFLQRYSRRRANSNWSEINAYTVRRLIASGHMRLAGLSAVRRAMERGKWPVNVPAVSVNPPLADGQRKPCIEAEFRPALCGSL